MVKLHLALITFVDRLLSPINKKLIKIKIEINTYLQTFDFTLESFNEISHVIAI